MLDYSSMFSERSKRFTPPAIRGLLPLEQRPNMISLLAGKPNPQCFPFENITMKLKDGQEITVGGDDLNEGLQYGATRGLPRLCKWLTELQQKVHGLGEPTEWAVDMGSGSQDCMHVFFASVLNDGDYVLLDAPSYPGTLGMLNEYNPNFVEVASDDQGMMATDLEKQLANWPADRRKPKLIYTIPTGSNPAGTCASKERKIELLKIAKKYDIMLAEDDAYYYLYYGDQPQAPSLLALEEQVTGETGRVVRFDSFSKIVSSGIRIGFFTGPKPICDRMDLIRANTVLQVPSTTQMMIHGLLEHWGHDEFLQHCRRVSDFYKKQRDMFEAAAEKHLKGVATWVSPQAGMFLYLNLNLGEQGDSQNLIANEAVNAGFLAVPGQGFMPSGSKTTCVRTSFSLSYPEQADEAFRRLADVLKAHRT